MISSISNLAATFQNYKSSPLQQTQSFNSVSNVYRADSFSFNNTSVIIPKDTVPTDPTLPPEPPIKTPFFDRPGVRVTGMLIGAGAVGGGLGYAIGSSLGRAGLGAAIGAGVGIATPIAMLAYALYSWGHK